MCQVFPKENAALVAGQFDTNAWTNDYETHPNILLKILIHFIVFPEKWTLGMDHLYKIYGRQILYQFSVLWLKSVNCHYYFETKSAVVDNS